MTIVSNTLNYLDEDVILEGFFAFDDRITERRPAVLISHAWCGRNDFVEEKAKQLAELGYLGFALDMYGKGILGTSVEQNSALMQPFMLDRAKLQQRITAAFNALRLMPWVDDRRIAAMGYCFGGLCVLDLARSGANLQGAISIHGLLNAPENLENKAIKAKVLALHGYDDPMVDFAQVQRFAEEMSTTGVDWQLHAYGNTMHAFTNPQANDPAFGTVYNPTADHRSWMSIQNFLTEIFK